MTRAVALAISLLACASVASAQECRTVKLSSRVYLAALIADDASTFAAGQFGYVERNVVARPFVDGSKPMQALGVAIDVGAYVVAVKLAHTHPRLAVPAFLALAAVRGYYALNNTANAMNGRSR